MHLLYSSLYIVLGSAQPKCILEAAIPTARKGVREREREIEEEEVSPPFLRKIRVSLRQRRQLVIECGTYPRAARPE